MHNSASKEPKAKGLEQAKGECGAIPRLGKTVTGLYRSGVSLPFLLGLRHTQLGATHE